MDIETQIARFAQSVKDFVDCVASLNGELYLKKIDDWSPRDVVAHLVGWNRYIIEGSNQIQRGELPFYDIDPGEDYCKVNARLVQEYSSTDREELLDNLQASAQELMQFLRTLDPDEWGRDFGVRHKASVVTIRNTVDELIEDYDIHRERIEEWARRQVRQKQD
ncbi:MAG: ClbS/DfsB family four-helix bundle protein [Candidatus Aminicenantales bacterium]